MNISHEKKFPKSKNGLQCLTPCYPANSWTIHPITLRYHKSTNPYCHVGLSISNDPNKIEEIDDCYNPISKDELDKIDVDFLIPLFDFNCNHFLILYNNIKNLADGMEYLEKKKYTSINTRARVVNCLLKVHGNHIEIVDQRLVDFFIELAKKKWINIMYDVLNKYIYANSENVKFIRPQTNNISYNDYKIERINFIIMKFLVYDEMYKFLNRYIKHRMDNWKYIENHIENIMNEYIIYISNKIDITLEGSNK